MWGLAERCQDMARVYNVAACQAPGPRSDGQHRTEWVESAYAHFTRHITPRRIARRPDLFVQFFVCRPDIFYQRQEVLAIVAVFRRVSNAPWLPFQSDGATSSDLGIGRSLNTVTKQVQSMALVAETLVDLVKVQSVLHRTGLDQVSFGNFLVFIDQAVGKSEGEDRVWVELGSTEDDHVSKAFLRPVHTIDVVRIWVNAGHVVSAVLAVEERISYLPIKLIWKSTFS